MKYLREDHGSMNLLDLSESLTCSTEYRFDAGPVQIVNKSRDSRITNTRIYKDNKYNITTIIIIMTIIIMIIITTTIIRFLYC